MEHAHKSSYNISEFDELARITVTCAFYNKGNMPLSAWFLRRQDPTSGKDTFLTNDVLLCCSV